MLTGSLPVLVVDADIDRYQRAVGADSGSEVFNLFLNERVFGTESICNESILGVEAVWVDGGSYENSEGNRLLNEYALEKKMMSEDDKEDGAYKWKVIIKKYDEASNKCSPQYFSRFTFFPFSFLFLYCSIFLSSFFLFSLCCTS